MKTENIDISVIIPMYNAEKYINNTLESVFNQETHGFSIEIIVVNDCSTDRSLQIVENISDNRLIIIDLKKNVGLSEARNTGIRKARGEWIEFLDSDDQISKDLFRKFSKTKDNISNLYLFSLITEFPNYTLKQDIKRINDKRAIGHFGVAVKYFIKKEICVFFRPGYYFEDMIFNMELMNKKDLKPKLIEGAYYIYNRKNESSIIANFKEKEFKKTFDYCYSMLDNCDRLTKLYFLEVFGSLIFNRSRPFKLSLIILIKCMSKLFYLMPYLVLNNLKTNIKSIKTQF